MESPSKTKPKRTSPALPIGVLALGVVITGAGALVTASVWSSLPASQGATLKQAQLQSRWAAIIRSAPQPAREGSVLSDAARELAPSLGPQPSHAPQIGQRLRDAMAAPSTQVGRLLIAAALIAQAESDGRPTDQVWTAIKPYVESGPTAPFRHFSAPLNEALGQLYRECSTREGTALALAATGPEALSPFLQYFIPRLTKLADARIAAADPAGAENCRKTARRLLREWTIEPGRIGTRLVAADLLARELGHEPANTKLVESLHSWRRAYRDSARLRGQPTLGVASEPDLCPAEHAGLVAAVAGSLWLFVAAALAGLAAVTLTWSVLREPVVLRDWRILAIGGVTAIVVAASAGVTIRNGGPAIGDDLRGLMSRVMRDAPAKPKRADSWHSAYRAQLPWAAAGWTLVALGGGAFAGALVRPGNRLSGVAGALLVGWVLIAITWTAQSAWGVVRVNRYESALADAYRKGVYAAVAGESAEALLLPVRDWQP